ncbi:MAG: (d)CMP kinase [Acholeplasmatales bacterium]|nr:MAG: (d)CMP kinase [Acholeplasmatales bacterium]
MSTVQIAIDGPAGAGKSTIAKRVAEAFGFVYIDTGAMYRAITLKAIRLGIDLADEAAFAFIDKTHFEYRDGELYMDDENVSRLIRTREISNQVSLVSAHFEVRRRTVARQRLLASNTSVVMDGRDIGYHVLPDATFKFFLTADVQTRAKRRFQENRARGIFTDMQELEREIIARDAFDSNREHSPLRPAEDAIVIDTSDMSIEDVVATIKVKVREDE